MKKIENSNSSELFVEIEAMFDVETTLMKEKADRPDLYEYKVIYKQNEQIVDQIKVYSIKQSIDSALAFVNSDIASYGCYGSVYMEICSYESFQKTTVKVTFFDYDGPFKHLFKDGDIIEAISSSDNIEKFKNSNCYRALSYSK